MLRINNVQRLELITALLLYAAVLVYQGYQYGQGDQSQILPVLYAQDHPGAYANDHYVSRYLDSDINERTIFHFLLRHLGYDQPWIVFGWHVLLSVTLILAWLRIAGLGIRHIGYQSLAVASVLIVGFHTSMGSNEIYYNSVIPSLAAKALGSWALYCWLRHEYNWWIVLLVIAGFLQPLVGIQLFILTCLSSFLYLLFAHNIKEFPWKHSGVYLLISLPWLYLLHRYNGGDADPKAFMEIMEFRLSHHFFPSYFGWVHLLIGGLFAIGCLRFYKQRMLWFIIIIVFGCIVYTFGVEHYRLPIFLYTQWWKTTIWLEAFAFIAIAVYIEKGYTLPRLFSRFQLAAPILILTIVCAYRLNGFIGSKPEYMLPLSTAKSDEVDISEQAGKLTPDSAVFIVPVDFTAFRWYSKRSTYVDYKAMFHQQDFLTEWYQRIQNIYAYSLKEKQAGFDINIFSTSLLEEPSSISIDFWRSIGITHILSTSPDIKSLKLIGSNKTYSIYSLNP